jgi:hypothetical protein
MGNQQRDEVGVVLQGEGAFTLSQALEQPLVVGRADGGVHLVHRVGQVHTEVLPGDVAGRPLLQRLQRQLLGPWVGQQDHRRQGEPVL